jgi:hypothetical protein
MLGLSLDDLCDRLGYGDGEPPPPTTLPTLANQVPVGSLQVTPGQGRVRVQLHLNLPPDVAGKLVALLGEAHP